MWLLAALIFIFLQPAACSNILGIFSVRLPSHYPAFDALMKGLAERGHNVTVYTVFPQNPTLSAIVTYTNVSLVECFQEGSRESFPSLEKVLSCDPIQRLQEMRGTFDLLITETFRCDFFALFGQAILNVPVILTSSAAPNPWMCDLSGMPCHSGYVPATTISTVGHIFGALGNTFSYFVTRVSNHFSSCQERYDLVPIFFPPGTPTIEEAMRNASLWFINTHHSMNRALPLVPNVVDIGGIGIGPAKELPQDIEKFMNESAEGVVYCSMDSFLAFGRYHDGRVWNVLSRAFAKLPQRVILKGKYSSPSSGHTDIMMIDEAFSGRDILAHPKVKLLVTNGDSVSISEAVHEGVPVLGIPVTNEQRLNIRNIEESGAGELLDVGRLAEDVVHAKMRALIYDKQYKKNAMDLSRRYNDRLVSPLETAIYWTEFVIRNRGAPHLKSDRVWMSFYQYMHVDTIFLCLSLDMLLYFSILRRCLKLCPRWLGLLVFIVTRLFVRCARWLDELAFKVGRLLFVRCPRWLGQLVLNIGRLFLRYARWLGQLVLNIGRLFLRYARWLGQLVLSVKRLFVRCGRWLGQLVLSVKKLFVKRRGGEGENNDEDERAEEGERVAEEENINGDEETVEEGEEERTTEEESIDGEEETVEEGKEVGAVEEESIGEEEETVEEGEGDRAAEEESIDEEEETVEEEGDRAAEEESITDGEGEKRQKKGTSKEDGARD